MPFSGTRANEKGREPDRCSEEGVEGVDGGDGETRVH
jgi:hypothetical protein